MRVASPDPELDLTIVEDQDAEAIDWDAEIARFLLAFVRKQATSAGTSATEPSINISEDDERQ